VLRIYGFQTFNLGKVLLSAEEMSLDYEFVELNPMKGELSSEENLQRHPLGKMPSIDWDGFLLFESNVICQYMAEKTGKLYGKDAQERAIIRQWIDFMGYHVGRHLGLHWFEKEVRPKYFDTPADTKAIEESLGFLEKQLPVLENHLKESEFFANQLSIADTIAFNYFHVHEVSGFPLHDFKAIHGWYERMKKRPSYKAATNHFSNGLLTL